MLLLRRLLLLSTAVAALFVVLGVVVLVGDLLLGVAQRIRRTYGRGVR